MINNGTKKYSLPRFRKITEKEAISVLFSMWRERKGSSALCILFLD